MHKIMVPTKSHMYTKISLYIHCSTVWFTLHTIDNTPVPLSRNLGPLTSWNHLGHSKLVTGLLYLYLYTYRMLLIDI